MKGIGKGNTQTFWSLKIDDHKARFSNGELKGIIDQFFLKWLTKMLKVIGQIEILINHSKMHFNIMLGLTHGNQSEHNQSLMV